MTTNVLLRTAVATAGLTAIAGAALITTAGASSAANTSTEGSGRTLTAALAGSNEVPGPGQTGATGQATVTINPGSGELCGRFAWQTGAPLVAMHIHEAEAGVAGPVVVPLNPAGQGGPQNQQCVTITRDLAREIIKDPSEYYVNMHTAAFPGGAVRGQLGK